VDAIVLVGTAVRAYDDGGYVSIDYSALCNPPLTKSDSVWFAQRLGQTQTQK